MLGRIARRQLSLAQVAVRRYSSVTHQYITVSKPSPAVTLVTLNRPKALNALSSPLFSELNRALEEADADSHIGAIVITGSEKAFAGMQPLIQHIDRIFIFISLVF